MKDKCPKCGGCGYTAEHDIMQNHNPEDGSCLTCPVQAQCSECGGTGEIELCREGMCDGSGYVMQGEHDDVEERRCLCNPKPDVEADMDDDS